MPHRIVCLKKNFPFRVLITFGHAIESCGAVKYGLHVCGEYHNRGPEATEFSMPTISDLGGSAPSYCPPK
jgi:hypothetical protein